MFKDLIAPRAELESDEGSTEDSAGDECANSTVNSAVLQIQMIEKSAEVPLIEPTAFPTPGEVIQEVYKTGHATEALPYNRKKIIRKLRWKLMRRLRYTRRFHGYNWSCVSKCEDKFDTWPDDDEFYVQCDECYSTGITEQSCTQCKFVS